MLSFLLSSSLVLNQANAHGRLTVPTTRLGDRYAYENDPVGFDGKFDDFACRRELNPNVVKPTFTAGQEIDVEWLITALHVGDAEIYLSYDYSKPKSELHEMKFFKIANFKSPKDFNNQPNKIALPDYLPAGDAVLRWQWVALHVFPVLELYVQCSDIRIVRSSGTGTPLADIPKYEVVAQDADGSFLPLTTGQKPFWNPFGGEAHFFTGPECALDFTKNACAGTARGTKGWVDMFNGAQPPPTQDPVSLPAPVTEPTPRPVEPPTEPPAGCTYYLSYAGASCDVSSDCCAAGLKCFNLNAQYSGCFEECWGPKWACATGPPVAAPVEAPTAPPVTQPSGCNINRASGAQCDGETYNEDESQRGCCAEGLKCYKQNQWWSGCYESCPTWAAAGEC